MNDMTANPHNEKDPAFLLSRDLDGDLSADERRALQAQLRQSHDLRAESEAMEAASGLVRQWGAASPEVDWDAHLSMTVARLDEETEAGDAALNSLLGRWAAKRPAIDEEQFAATVLAKIRTKRRQPAYRMILRWSAPLAAAAVFVFMVTAVFWQTPPVKTVAIVQIGGFVDDSAVGAFPTDGRAEVSFARADASADVDDSGIGLLTLGVSSTSRSADAAPL